MANQLLKSSAVTIMYKILKNLKSQSLKTYDSFELG